MKKSATTTSATLTDRPTTSSPIIQDATTLSLSEFISTQITTTALSSNVKIFVADIDRKEIFATDLTDSKLSFMSINATREPDGYITHYSAGSRICWTYTKTRIYCADENGANMMTTYSFYEKGTEQNEIRGLAVAEAGP
nr:uncharacterized protein LOC129261666 [Lytechinus pictus]